MIIVPNERITRACILTLRDTIFKKQHLDKQTELLNTGTKKGYKITDDKDNKMFCLRLTDEFLLNNLNGPAFLHHSGKEILFILNKSFTPVEYENNFYIKYVKQSDLLVKEQPVVGGTMYPTNTGYLAVDYNYSGSKIRLETFNKNFKLNSINDYPAKVDFIYEKRIGWYVDGKLHRTDGPAVIQGFDKKTGEEGTVEYWINGEMYDKKTFDEYFSGIESKEDKDMLSDLGQSFD
jgi:hypothetical protein